LRSAYCSLNCALYAWPFLGATHPVIVGTSCDCPTTKSFDGMVGNDWVPLMRGYVFLSYLKTVDKFM
jgi:hypothetical protein